MLGIRNVIVGVSGGVDSAVTTLLLKNKGFNVTGVFMRNWDIADETGHCAAEQDYADAEWTCKKLNVPLLHVNFVKEYWNEVFSDLLRSYESGYTPNPDIECNKAIKFNSFYNYVRKELKADAIATGHYANTSFGSYLENFKPDTAVKLLQATDTLKDQTFFLSQISQESLRRTMFPLGRYLKKDVKKMAIEAGLEVIARKKESMGICFIGSRHFQDFISEYVENKPGKFIDLESGFVVGNHEGIHHWTLGQRCRISGVSKAYYIFRKDLQTNDIYVVPGTDHPALFTELIVTSEMHWIEREPEALKDSKGLLHCDFRFQHTHRLVPCSVFKTPDNRLIIHLSKPLRAITPGQFAVLYSGDECLGSAKIQHPGPSYHTLNKRMEFVPNSEVISEI